ncbi:MAG: VWA domain-containing protein [Deltaproteobacteria bacterium]|nr:VWA domain-containing protein [Deltaproteobacteria bacterium]MCB9788218.1 VWA domain-containing protein [Deltaproteobacteria bacterium]
MIVSHHVSLTRWTALSSVAVGLLALAGCGSGGLDPASEGAPLGSPAVTSAEASASLTARRPKGPSSAFVGPTRELAAEAPGADALAAGTTAAGTLSLANTQVTFAPGSLIIPMDVASQDEEIFLAFGLVYELLRNNVPVQWVVQPGKSADDVDFVASTVDFDSGDAHPNRAYRGGPFVILASDAAAAEPVIADWQHDGEPVVHRASSAFDAQIARTLVVAPTIAMFRDDGESITRDYLRAADIPDSAGDTEWKGGSPDTFELDELEGASATDHRDGALFDEDGDPVYCQLVSTHFKFSEARDNPEVGAEVRSFLEAPTQLFAGCEAALAFENLPQSGHMLSPNGLLARSFTGAGDVLRADRVLAQLDGEFKGVKGSARSFSPCQDAPPAECEAGGAYLPNVEAMVVRSGYAAGSYDVWLSGHLGGACPPDIELCEPSPGQWAGRINYLGGHDYQQKLPISEHPKSQGTRLFLQSLLAAPCASAAGQPVVSVVAEAPASTTTATLTVTLHASNAGPTTALAATLRYTIPAGASFASASGGGQAAAGVVSWDLGNLGAGETQTRQVVLSLGATGTYASAARVLYQVGLNSFSRTGAAVQTVYGGDSDGDGVMDGDDICPAVANPLQDLAIDPASCGACGLVCAIDAGVPGCVDGECVVAGCDAGHADCDGDVGNGCEYDTADFASDAAHCGGCGVVCAAPHGTVACSEGACVMESCPAGLADCNGDTSDGCEYDVAGLESDDANCGACGVVCDPAHGAGECSGGACTIVSCDEGHWDCNGDPADGCEHDEASLESDVDNCGGCGVVCTADQGEPACVTGVCTLGACDAGHANCNGDPSDGCEYDASGFASDHDNCGGCGVTCDMTGGVGACVDGACALVSCDADAHDCNGDPTDGCEVSDAAFATDPFNCGGCGVVCSDPLWATTCNAGVCELAACDSTFVGESCGLGVCERFESCEGGHVRKCQPGAPTMPVEAGNCDTLDNDCDGLTDEAYDDGVACTTSACVNGVAINVPDDSLCGDDNPCTDDWCHPTFGCVSFPDDTNAPDPAADDGEPCTDLICSFGSSINVPDDSNVPDDGLACTVDSCDNGTELHTVTADTCLIDGACYGAGAVGPGAPCGVCNPDLDHYGFESTIFQDGFDDGDVSNWTIARLSAGASTWQLSGKRAWSPSKSLWFGRAGTSGYGDGTKQVQAYAQTPEMHLPAGTTPQLSFRLWLKTQGYISSVRKDVLYVEVVDAGGHVTAIWNSTSALEGTTSDDFYPIFVGLGDWAGQSIRVRFRFDSYDGSSNDFEGAYLDDVSVDTACCLASSDCDDDDACTVDLCRDASCGHVDTCVCAPARSELLVLLDFSGSMEDPAEIGGSVSKWEAAVSALGDSLSYFAPLLITALKLFRTPGSSSSCTVVARSLEQPFGAEPAQITSYLESKWPAGSTPMAAGLQGARDVYASSPEVGDARFVLLVTDGKETCGGDPVARIKDLASDGIATYVLGFGTGVDPKVLNAAAISGGRARPQLYPGDKAYWSATSAEEVELAISKIIAEVASEQCNGEDDDCDGLTDEGISDIGCEAADCNGSPLAGVSRCVDGAWSECAADPSTETCNGLDDNCNGIVDDRWRDEQGPVLGTPCAVGRGACKRWGTWVCPVDGVSEATCSAAPGAPTPEVCDDIDNDCDGVTDEGQVRSCSAGCSTGTESCFKGSWVLCTAVAEADNQCDGIDNDCDGVTDPLYPMRGLACDGADSDFCANGTWTCKASGFGVECANEHPADILEVCGGGDEDCDGATDEEGAVGCTNYWVDKDKDGFGAGAPRCLCAPRGAYNTPNGADCDDTRASVNPNGVEVCNGLDDDCDGLTDEDPHDPSQPLRQSCYTGEPETLDVGACHAGTETCTGGAWGACTGEVTPAPELCDGIDGDCDGVGDLDEPTELETPEDHPCAATSYCWFDTCYCVLNRDVDAWQCILE